MTNYPLITLAAQMLIYASILYALHFTTKQVGDPKQRMLTMVSVGFVAMVLIYVVDKIAPNVDMLSVAESGAVMNMVGDMMLIIIGYYFGTKDGGEK